VSDDESGDSEDDELAYVWEMGWKWRRLICKRLAKWTRKLIPKIGWCTSKWTTC